MDAETILVASAKRLQRRCDDLAQIRVLPTLPCQDVMPSGERHETGLERLLKRRIDIAAAKGLRRNGLNGRQGVLHPMVQLIDQDLLSFISTPFLRPITEYLQRPPGLVIEPEHHA